MKPIPHKPAVQPAKPSPKIIKRLQFDPEFRPVTVGPVLKAQVMTAYDEARSIVSEARREAERIRSEVQATRKQAVTEKEAERERGYEDGREEGYEELSERILEAELAKEKVLADAEPQIIRMVMDIAEKVIGREVREGAVVDVVKKAVSQAVGRRILIKVNPADSAVLKEREKELASILDQTQSVSVKEDEGIPAGGCVLETEMGAVDARLETQLAAIKRALGLVE